MSFGYYNRSPEQVQRDNGAYYDFEKIASKYEHIKPLRGKKRGHLNIRPNGERSRSWERIVKVDDNEYYLTNTAYGYWEMHPEGNKNGREHCRAITFKKVGDIETIILHTPRRMWGDKPNTLLEPKALSAPSNFYFYDCNLPHGVGMTRYYTKVYAVLQNSETAGDYSYFTLDQGDVHITRKIGDKYFKPLIAHREVHRSLDRKKTKALREEISQFKEYVKAMLPLAPKMKSAWYGKTPLSLAEYEANTWDEDFKKFCSGKSWRELIGARDEVPDHWFELVSYYKRRCGYTRWNAEARDYDWHDATTQTVMSSIQKEIYKQEKPLHEELVELGTRTFDAYRSW